LALRLLNRRGRATAYGQFDGFPQDVFRIGVDDALVEIDS
jgi:hypothetical protein